MKSLPTIHLDRALTRDGKRIESRIHLDHLHRVIAARAAENGLLEGGAFQQESK